MPNNAFVLEEQLDPLLYDFRIGGVGPHGRIPEPSTAQVNAFLSSMRTVFEPLQDVVSAVQGKGRGKRKTTKAENVEEIQNALESLEMDDGQAQELLHQVNVVASDLCSNTPSPEDLDGLPYRAQRVFVGWLMGSLLGEALAPATK